MLDWYHGGGTIKKKERKRVPIVLRNSQNERKGL